MFVYTEQMDAEGLGRKLLLTPSGDPRGSPEKQTVGTVTAFSKNANPASTFELSHCRRCKGGCLGRGEAFGALRQSVPQNSRVHFLEDRNLLKLRSLDCSLSVPERKSQCMSILQTKVNPMICHSA